MALKPKVTMLPWAESREEKLRLFKLVTGFLGGSMMLIFLINLIPYPELDRSKAEKVPERIAKMILEKQKEEPPPPPPPLEPEEDPTEDMEPLVEAEPEPEPEPEPAPLPELEPETEVAEVIEPPKQDDKPKKEKEVVEQAKEKAAKTGVLAMSSKLSTLSTLTNVPRQGNTSLTTDTEASSQRNENDLINQRAEGGSGGVATTEVAKQESQQLADRETTRIQTASAEAEAEEAARNKLRTSEEIRLTFDQYKNSFYALYKRALRSNLGLQGRVVFNLTIAPDGSVTFCEVVSSELNDAELERKLVSRIMTINFGAKDVKEWKEEYFIDFSPGG